MCYIWALYTCCTIHNGSCKFQACRVNRRSCIHKCSISFRSSWNSPSILRNTLQSWWHCMRSISGIWCQWDILEHQFLVSMLPQDMPHNMRSPLRYATFKTGQRWGVTKITLKRWMSASCNILIKTCTASFLGGMKALGIKVKKTFVVQHNCLIIKPAA